MGIAIFHCSPNSSICLQRHPHRKQPLVNLFTSIMLKIVVFALVCSVIMTASVSMDASNAKSGFLNLRKRTAELADETEDAALSRGRRRRCNMWDIWFGRHGCKTLNDRVGPPTVRYTPYGGRIVED